jgi:phosphinothricin acetyltransferase
MNVMGATIRRVSLEDATALADIYRPIVEATTISFEETPPDEEAFRSRISQTAAAYPWIVACNDERVLGYAYAGRHRERAGYRHSVDVSIYLADDARRRGIGTMLYSQLFDLLGEYRFHRAFAGITLPNEASIALHRRFGFSEVGVYHEVGYKFGRWLDVLWLEKPV